MRGPCTIAPAPRAFTGVVRLHRSLPHERGRSRRRLRCFGSLLTRLWLGGTSRGGTETAPGSGTQPSGAHERRPVRRAMGAGSTKRWALAVLGLVCLLPFDFISCDTPPTYGVVNENVTLSPSNPKSFRDVLWKKGKDKVVEWDEKYGLKVYGRFTDRVHLDTTFGNLTIFNLTSSDEDTYELEYETGKETFILKTLEPLPDPILNCSVIDENITVNCLIPEDYHGDPHLINYSWHCPSAQCNNSFGSVMYFGKNDDRSQNVQCTVHDPVYKRTSSLDLTSCIPREHSRNRYYLLLAIGLTVIVAVLIVKGCLK